MMTIRRLALFLMVSLVFSAVSQALGIDAYVQKRAVKRQGEQWVTVLGERAVKSADVMNRSELVHCLSVNKQLDNISMNAANSKGEFEREQRDLNSWKAKKVAELDAEAKRLESEKRAIGKLQENVAQLRTELDSLKANLDRNASVQVKRYNDVAAKYNAALKQLDQKTKAFNAAARQHAEMTKNVRQQDTRKTSAFNAGVEERQARNNANLQNAKTLEADFNQNCKFRYFKQADLEPALRAARQ